jgi:hypothetical protein
LIQAVINLFFLRAGKRDKSYPKMNATVIHSKGDLQSNEEHGDRYPDLVSKATDAQADAL